MVANMDLDDLAQGYCNRHHLFERHRQIFVLFQNKILCNQLSINVVTGVCEKNAGLRVCSLIHAYLFMYLIIFNAYSMHI